jgi:hypothetical protein
LKGFDLRQMSTEAFSMLATQYEYIGKVRLDWLFCFDLPVLREELKDSLSTWVATARGSGSPQALEHLK